ncbi:MAG TPA: hypothetical protein VJ506_08615, partial [Candidatus Limnocylindrales bacterium]|nr:hypothetical protein [Candidatus Limnocylindrales bacterium]
MTLQVLVIAVVRIVGSLPVLRWPLAGGLLAIVVDLSDLLLRDALDLGGVPDYQSLDKWLDQVYLALFLVVALRWRGLARRVAIALYAFRFVGFVVFELGGDRSVLLLFPNVFEFWFLLVAAIHRFRPDFTWTPRATALALAVVAPPKEAQEWALHGGRIFDGISSIDALRVVW